MTADIKPQRSTLLNIFSWILILFWFFTFFTTAAQFIAVYYIIPMEEIEPVTDPEVPPLFVFLTENIYGLFLSAALFSGVMFMVSVGLWRRKEWARRAFRLLLYIGIIVLITSVVFMFAFFKRAFYPNDEIPEELVSALKAMRIVWTVFAGGFVLFFDWIARKLNREHIRNEFRPNLSR